MTGKTGQFRSAIRYPRTSSPKSLQARAVAQAYNFPLHATGHGYVGGIIELGGGYNLNEVQAWFRDNGLATPTFIDVHVDGGANNQDGPDGADGEVQLDMLVAGAIAGDATFRIYFATNTDAGFLKALRQAVSECDGVSISWGGPENQWSAHSMQSMDAVIKAARAQGVPVFVAAGDTGSQDSSGAGNQTDFPASSPSAIGCGGTRLLLAGTQRSSEVVWDDNDLQSATGGGKSKVFPGRDVPDVAGNADPDTGYRIAVDGQSMVVGGTSAVAPLMLGLHALLWQINGGKPFDMLNLIVTNPQACYDVTAGDNGGYRAGPGRDQVTGFGVPDGQKLADALSGSAPVPPAPPAPTPQPAPGGSSAFPAGPVAAWLEHKHDHTHVEAIAAAAIKEWATLNGISLEPPS